MDRSERNIDFGYCVGNRSRGTLILDLGNNN
jgi:hypothetical protein